MARRFLAGWFVLVTLLAIHGRLRLDARRELRCAMDGNRIEPIHRVDLVLDGQLLRSFCSIACARQWPELPAGAYWQLRDEVSGRLLDSRRAHFVASRLVTVPARQERIHVFANWADAHQHASQFGGQRLADPLAAPKRGPDAR